MTAIDRLRNIVRNKNDFDTLGGRSKFKAEINNNNCLIITISSDKEFEVSDALAAAVLKRYESSSNGEKYMTSNYTDPAWQDCPNRIVSPYVARIFKEESLPNKQRQR